jgi:hypothetical protein
MNESAWINDLEKICALRKWPVQLARWQVTRETGAWAELGTGDPTAVNPDSQATGLMQVRPATALDLLQNNPSLLKAILQMPSVSVYLGIHFLSTSCMQEASNLGFMGVEATKCALAVYNAGAGSVRKAAESFSAANQGKKPTAMEQIDSYLPAQASLYWRDIWDKFDSGST